MSASVIRKLEKTSCRPRSYLVTAHLESALRPHFGEGGIGGYEPVIPLDRGSQHMTILSSFITHRQSFLTEMFREERVPVIQKTEHQAAADLRIGRKVNCGHDVDSGVTGSID